jgi:hypothetical protein
MEEKKDNEFIYTNENAIDVILDYISDDLRKNYRKQTLTSYWT